VLITEHLDKKHSSYCVYDNYRSIASFIDGQKPSSRKIVYHLKNVKEFQKIDALANNTAGATQYLHGAISLEGVMKGMCQSFAGTNNISLVESEGYVGYRDEQEPGASRYVKARRAKISEFIFRKEDEDILTKQEFEGDEIEYKFFLPIIPLIAVNGSEGIGQGFAHKIIPRDPKEIIQYIFDKLDEKETSELLPKFKDFKTEITQLSTKQFSVIGALEVQNTSTIEITELPFTYDLTKYIKILNELEDQGIIRSFKDKSKKNNFLFEVKVTRAAIQNKSYDEILSMFKLKTTITENYTLLDENNKITIFDDIYQIIDRYIDIRLQGYRTRKKFRIKQLESEIITLQNKASFIEDVNSGKISLKQKKSELIEKLLSFNYQKINSDYEYLFSITALQFTDEKVNELKKKITELQDELKLYSEKDIKDIWKEELKELMKQLGEKLETQKVIIKKPKKITEVQQKEISTKVEMQDILSLF